MKFDFYTLTNILKSKNFNFTKNEDFSFLNIAKPSGDLLKQVDTSNELYFVVYEVGCDKDGWYEKDFDRREYIDTVLNHNKNMAIVTDSKDIVERYKNTRKIMYVPSLPHAINKLYNYTLQLVKPKVVAITGSVGKTTSVCLMEDIINQEHNTLRLYSKRITPLNLRSMIINFLNKEHDFVALEMSMNRKNHIQKLVDMLPPDFAAILNITNAHIGSQDIFSQNDIWDSKKAIFKGVQHPVLNIDYPIINKNKYECDNAVTFGINEKNNPNLLGKVKNNKLYIEYKGTPLFECSPYILTELSVYQILASTAIGMQMKIAPENMRMAIDNFIPKEHRLISYENNNQKIIFDGDITLSSRLKELANNYYDSKTLIISNLYTHNGNDTPENIQLQKRELAEVFDSFDKVLVADNIKDILLDNKIQKYQTFSPKELESIIKNQKNTYFIHHSVFFRDNIAEQKNGCFFELQKALKQVEDKERKENRNLIIKKLTCENGR